MGNATRLILVLAVACAAGLGCRALEAWAAPRFENVGAHEGAKEMTPSQCFACHMTGKDGAPVAPESMYGREDCWECHLSD